VKRRQAIILAPAVNPWIRRVDIGACTNRDVGDFASKLGGTHRLTCSRRPRPARPPANLPSIHPARQGPGSSGFRRVRQTFLPREAAACREMESPNRPGKRRPLDPLGDRAVLRLRPGTQLLKR
jgi:hypothetical protein